MITEKGQAPLILITALSQFLFYKGTVAILDGNTAYGFNSTGDLLYSCDTGTGSKRLILTSDNTAYVLSVNQVRYFDLSKSSTEDTAN